jgi:hypothetical protein
MKKINLIVLILLQFGFNVDAKKTPTVLKSTPASVASADKTVSAKPSTNPAVDPSITYKTSEINFEEANISSAATLYDHGKITELQLVNHGIRKKKVFGLATVKVYIMEFFAADPTQLDRTEDGILTSLKKAKAIDLKLTMARDLSGTKISDSFKEALEHNGLDINNLSKEMQELMAELSSVKEFEKGQAISLLATWKDSSATLFIGRPDGSIKTITGNETFATDLFAIWFGKPADDKLADLKKTLIK